MISLSFDDMRSEVVGTTEGQILDSFFAVEIGISDYQACWDAHIDSYNLAGVEASEATVISLFLAEMVDMLEATDEIFERVLGANL